MADFNTVAPGDHEQIPEKGLAFVEAREYRWNCREIVVAWKTGNLEGIDQLLTKDIAALESRKETMRILARDLYERMAGRMSPVAERHKFVFAIVGVAQLVGEAPTLEILRSLGMFDVVIDGTLTERSAMRRVHRVRATKRSRGMR